MTDKILVRNIFAAVFEKPVLDPLLELFKVRPWRTERSDLIEVKFWGTEGTIKYVKVKGFSGKSIVRGFDFDGRVKSLDRANFVRILADRSNLKHLEELKKEGRVILSEAKNLGNRDPSSATQDDRNSEPFDIVIVNLYAPDRKNFPESMDIGGQALIRAAIKNYKNVAVAFDAASIKGLTEELKRRRGSTSLAFRKKQAKKAAKFIAERTKLEAEMFDKG